MTFPTLPMGSLMAVAMLIVAAGLAALPPGQPRRGGRRLGSVLIGTLAVLSAAWQLAWYASRHLGTFWGAMATASGLALCAGAWLLLSREIERTHRRWRWPIGAALVALAVYYLVAIARL